MKHKIPLAIAGACAALSPVASEARSVPKTAMPASVQQLLACRAVADGAQRLACFDRQASVVDRAVATRELVVIDKARASAAKRSLFGFSVPNFGGLFGGGDEDVKQIESSVTGASRNQDGGWTVRLADGSTWTQVDDSPLGLPPTRGDKVVVKRGTLGSFYLQLGRQPGFKAKRIG